MKLLVDAHVFDGKYQGTRTYLEGLYTHLTQHDDIDFYFAAQYEDRLKSVFGESDNIHYVHLSSGNRLKRLAFEYPQVIKEYRIDYAHFQYISPLFKTCKEIVTVHDLLFMDFPEYFPSLYKIKNEFLFKKSAKRADLLLTVSEFSRDEIVRHFGISKDRIHIIYNSILPDSNSSGDIDLKSLYGLDKFILTVSRLEPRKNHISLMKAFFELGLMDKGYKLVMIGSKDLQNKELFEYYEKLPDNQKEKVLFLQVPFSHLVELYKHAALFVFPSYGEGFGIPPIEAIAYGCPLLCSNATAMSEFELPNEIMFNPSDLDELKKKMTEQLVRPFSNKCYRNTIMMKYNWQNIADSYYSILHDHYK